jgi:hypothetical protein
MDEKADVMRAQSLVSPVEELKCPCYDGTSLVILGVCQYFSSNEMCRRTRKECKYKDSFDPDKNKRDSAAKFFW